MATKASLDRSTLLIQKMVTGAPVVNLYQQWSIICTKLPQPKMESKELPTHDFAGEDGEDTYIPSFIPTKPYDSILEFEYVGNLDSCYNNIYLGFLKYLRGNAPTTNDYDSITEGGFKIYDRHNLIGRQKVYLKSFDPEDLVHLTDGDHLIFKLTFRFTDPTTDITLTDPQAKVTL
jgi:hypothetical protein